MSASLRAGASDAALQYNGVDVVVYDSTGITQGAQPVSEVPTGSTLAWHTTSIPTGYLECDGAAISMTTYEDLYDVVTNTYGMDAGTTFTAAASDIITAVGHGLSASDVIEVTTSAADLPDGLTIGTKYYVKYLTTDTFSVSLTAGGADVDILDTGTGTHSFHSDLKVPDFRGEFLRGWDNGRSVDPDKASRTDRGDGTTGDVVGSKQGHQLDSHAHTQARGGDNTGTSFLSLGASSNTGTQTSSSVGGNETRPRNVNVMYCIKY